MTTSCACYVRHDYSMYLVTTVAVNCIKELQLSFGDVPAGTKQPSSSPVQLRSLLFDTVTQTVQLLTTAVSGGNSTSCQHQFFMSACRCAADSKISVALSCTVNRHI